MAEAIYGVIAIALVAACVVIFAREAAELDVDRRAREEEMELDEWLNRR